MWLIAYRHQSYVAMIITNQISFLSGGSLISREVKVHSPISIIHVHVLQTTVCIYNRNLNVKRC